MKNRVSDVIEKAGYKAAENVFRKIVNWNRAEKCKHGAHEVRLFLEEENRKSGKSIYETMI